MDTLKKIQKLVGSISYEQLRFIDFAIAESFGIFVPTLGPCRYSVTPDHSHPAYMVIINIHSECLVHIDNKSKRCEPGRIYFFSPEIRHHELIEEGFNRYYACMIERELFEKAWFHYSDTLPCFKGEDYPLTKTLLPYLSEFIEEYERHDDVSEGQLALLAERIVHKIIRTTNEQSLAPDVSFGSTIDKAIHLMHVRYATELNLDDIACFCGLSSAHFARAFKKGSGFTPMEFLKKIRLDNARKLLQRSEDSITEIAFQCGFNSSSHFATAFLAEYKQSPSEFRKKREQIR